MQPFYRIAIIGCGGTGGNFAARLSQYISTGHYPAEIVIVDGDAIEENNISRQPYISSEVMMNKAVAMASAIEDTYELSVTAYPQYLDTVDDLFKVFKLFYHNGDGTLYKDGERYFPVDVLIGCCDNHRCRQVMEKYFSRCSTLIYIDAANEFSAGEVVIGIKAKGKLLSPSRKFYFPELMKSRKKRKSEESCGTVNSHSPQHLATNCFAANILLTVVAKLIADEHIAGGIIYFDTFNFSCIFREYKEDAYEKTK